MLEIGRNIGRTGLRAWGRLGRASGYQYQLVESYGPALAGSRLLSSRLPNGCRVHCDLRDMVQRQMWFYGAYEPIEAYLFTQLLRPGMVVIDAGANVGQYSMLAATGVGPSGSVHSFEPIPATFARLQKHVAENSLSNVQLNQIALWDKDTTVSLGMPAGMLNNAGAYSVRAGADKLSSIEAPAARLDTYCALQNLSRVDVIKMDIEGAEPFAISGGLEVIKKFRPTLLVEINRTALNDMGMNTTKFWEVISNLGYRIWRIGHSPETCGPVPDLECFVQSNAFLHSTDLPACVTSGWSYRTALKWARSGLKVRKERR